MKYLIVLSVLFLIGCATPVDPNNVTTNYDPYQKVTTHTGANFLTGYKRKGMLAATVGSESAQYGVYISDVYKNQWRMYRNVYDTAGKELPFRLALRDVMCVSECYFMENFTVTLTLDYIKAHRSTGIRFKVVGSAGSETFFVPPQHVSAFLTKVL